MNPENWIKVEELLNVALELEPAQRQKFLDKIGENSLRREVESLLEAEQQAEKFLASPAVALSADFFDQEIEATDARLNQKIGNYRIVRELGRGGMGAVFLAERSDGEFEQQVALKIVRRSFAAPELLRRFRQERQILASLNHPNIARLLDGGVSSDGEPFLAMEYVEGERITDYCRNRNLSTNERLKLFSAVCSAVGFAHQHLIVHRDIKPSNILVTRDGVPKLLDFGIAKLLDAEHLTENTETGYRAFTAEYASPEQIAGKTVTTASDIYSLGVLLEELLDDERRFRAAPPAFGKWRTEEAENSVETIAPRPTRQTNKNLTNAELNNIAAMAQREEPERRYASAAELAEDIRRYLNGLPVRAQRDNFTYRAGKFIKRNRLSAAAAALVLSSLIIGFAVAAWQAGVAREKARVAEANERRAELAAEKQRKITGFMERVLSYANPAWYAEGSKLGGQARVIDVLNELSNKIETEFPTDLDIQAELHHKCAEIFLANRITNRAEHHARRALELRRKALSETPATTGVSDLRAEVAKDLYYLGEVLHVQGNYAGHEKLLGQAAATFREVAPDNANLPYLLESLGILKFDIHEDYAEAEKLLAESLELFRRRDGELHFNTARVFFTLSIVAARKGEVARAEELFRTGETRVSQMPEVEQRLLLLRFRGELEYAKGSFAAAENACQQLIDESRKSKGVNNDYERNARGRLLEIYERENNWAKAVEIERATIEDMKNLMPQTSVGFGRQLARLSVYLLRYSVKTGEAKLYFDRAYRIFQENRQEANESPDFGYFLGEYLLLLKRREEALPILEETVELYKTNYSPNFRYRVRAEKLLEQARAL
ncbi:MAG: protein kinase [Acidobacteriota bacterium]|nr:protein kinase [Acidobacteriota bacterium]